MNVEPEIRQCTGSWVISERRFTILIIMVKPSKKKKKFIDKKNAVTFHLVHRSQKDPLAADEEAPQHVLLPSTNKQKKEEQKEEERKFGIFCDDDYDYLQHLKDVNMVPTLEPVERIRINRSELFQKEKIVLPSSVFASNVEEDIGLLNKAVSIKGPQPSWDPDVVAALDDDFDFSNPDNELDDDFITLANAREEQHDSETEKYFFSDNDDYNSSSECDNFFDDTDLFMKEETKSHFTNYSLSSSVLPRNDGLKFLDDKFEKIFEQYNNEEIGSLEGEEIEGYIQPNSELLDKTLQEFEIEQKKIIMQNGDEEMDSQMIIDDKKEDLVKIVVEESQEKWDCESILSNYSSLYNHPKLIKEPPKVKLNGIKISQKFGIPLNTLTNKSGGLTKEQLNRLDKSNESNSTEDKKICRRPCNETPEEKKLRKKTIKEQQKERRAEKKANTKAFKEEKKRQEKVILNLQQNLRSVKLL